MIEQNIVLAVHHVKYKSEENTSLFFLNYLYDEFGPVDLIQVSKLYNETFGEQMVLNPNEMGPFRDIDELNKFLFLLLQKNNYTSAIVLSNIEYNAVIDSSDSIAIVQERLLSSTNRIDNIEKKEKSGFFNKFFKD